jgi:hypothetical protein
MRELKAVEATKRRRVSSYNGHNKVLRSFGLRLNTSMIRNYEVRPPCL